MISMFDKLKEALGITKHEAAPRGDVADEYVRHLKRGDTEFQMNLGGASLQALWNEALRIEPGLVYTVTSYRAKDSGAYYNVYVTYRPNPAVCIEDMVVIKSEPLLDTLRNALEKKPTELYIVVNDSEALKAGLDALLNGREIPQLIGYNGTPFNYIENSAGWCCYRFEFQYDTAYMDECAHREALNAELTRIETLLHLKNLIPEVKVFLALSYIAQETQFSLDGGNSAYSALCEKNASARGFAEGYVELLNRIGIPSRVLEGRNNAIPGVEYAWALVRLHDDWYHVDPAVTLQGNQLYLGAFLCSNGVMQQDYTWNETVNATGFLYNAKQVLHTVRASERTLLSMGIPERYVRPMIEE